MAFSVVIPWLCLNPKIQKSISDSAIPKASTILKKFFVEAVNNVCDFPISQLPQLIVKGDMISIIIPNEEYLVGLASCKHNLHGRIIWPKGSVPLKVEVLKQKLSVIWVSLGKWGLTSLGKGFFEFSFSSIKDLQRLCSTSCWNLNSGLLKLFA